MNSNMGRNDRWVRTGIAALIAILYFSNVISGTLAAALGVIALVFAVTSLVGFCPLYTLLGMNTCGRKQP